MRRSYRNYGRKAQGGWWQLAAAAVSAYGAYRANKMSQDYARDMSGSAHQREVQDLRAAGLNPILSASGPGAGTPPAQFSNVGGEGVSSAMAARLNKAQVDLMKEQTVATTQAYWKDIAARELMLQQSKTEMEKTREMKWMADIASEQAKGARIEGDIDSGKVGEWSRILRRLIPGVNSAAGAARSLR